MSNPFFGGIPTAIDTKKLDAKYGESGPSEGTLIPHAEIAECIGHPWKSSRYRTVLDAYRRKLRKEFNVDTAVDPGRGLYVLLPPERMQIGKRDTRRSLRGFRRGGARIAATPDEGLTDHQRAERDKYTEIVWRISRATAQELKALEPPAPMRALPRRDA